MSTLLFMFAIAGFVLVAHWSYINDPARPSDGLKGWLRMLRDGVERPAAKKAQPRWRKDNVGVARTAPRSRTPARRLDQPEARWKRQPRRS